VQTTELRRYRLKYEQNLLESVVPFWERHAPDREYGGTFSCLDRTGRVFDTDKFTWLQGRAIWTFARLCQRYPDHPSRDAWLALAGSGAGFMRDHGQAASGDWYFALDRCGQPLVEPYNIFSDYFMAAGLGEYWRASGDDWARRLAADTFRRIQARKSQPKGIWTKQIGATRPLLTMSLPMMDAWMARELRGIMADDELADLAPAAERQVLERHVDRQRRAVFERVSPDGGHPDCMDGRLINPGHALEVLWFLLVLAEERGDRARIADIADIMLWCAERGWDTQYGGFFYYMDYEGLPTEKLEADMKLWWVHAEALCAFLLAYRLTGSQTHLDWFRRIDAYTFGHFPDPEHGEWYGYLDRRGDPALTLKGGKWKGFFHTPRALMACIDWLADMEQHGVKK
jgi:N-acylglucosamine 2-epimerase